MAHEAPDEPALRLPALASFADRLAWGMRQASPKLKNPDIAQASGRGAETVSRWRGGALPDTNCYEPIAALLRARGVPATADWLRTGVAPDTTAEGVRRSKEERAWLARFRAELIEQDASDAVVDTADALARAREVQAFYEAMTGDENPVAAMEWIADAIRDGVTDAAEADPLNRAGTLGVAGPRADVENTADHASPRGRNARPSKEAPRRASEGGGRPRR